MHSGAAATPNLQGVRSAVIRKRCSICTTAHHTSQFVGLLFEHAIIDVFSCTIHALMHLLQVRYLRGEWGVELIRVRPYTMFTTYTQEHLQIPYLLTNSQNPLHIIASLKSGSLYCGSLLPSLSLTVD